MKKLSELSITDLNALLEYCKKMDGEKRNMGMGYVLEPKCGDPYNSLIPLIEKELDSRINDIFEYVNNAKP